MFAIALFLVCVRNMSIKDKPSLCMVVADIDFFFSHRVALAKKLSEKFQIIVISEIKESHESKLQMILLNLFILNLELVKIN